MVALPVIVALALLSAPPSVRAAGPARPLPERLADTGIAGPDTVSFSPQYALWSDGAVKRRWIALPRGTAIDGTQADAWQFPVGTRLWKEFSVGSRKIETRFIERLADGTWRFASYRWNAQGTEARVAPAQGAVVEGVAGALQGRYEIPARADCLACHESAAVPVLGFSALQLSPDRDPLALHATPRGDIELQALVARGLLRGYRGPAQPRIEADPPARAALGLLHANCGHCHNDSGNGVPVPLVLSQSAADTGRAAQRALTSLIAPSRMTGIASLVPGDAAASLLVQRMRSRDARRQMPPLGTRMADADGLALIERWISPELKQENTP
jgi:cytochrome c553